MGGESGDVDKYYICTIPGQYYVIMCLRIVDSHGGKHTSVPCTIPRLLYYHNYSEKFPRPKIITNYKKS
jgi:hypothetical protein